MLKAAILTVLSEIGVTVSLGGSTGVIVGVGVGVISGVDVAIPVTVEVGDDDTLFTLFSIQPENSIITAINNMHEMVLPVILFLIILNMHEMVLPVILFLIILRFISKSPLIYLIFYDIKV